MSLRKKATMTEEKLFANRFNGKRSEGPATPEGRERIREANTRHGFYSAAEAVALACLGEDSDELERLRPDLHGDLQPPSGLQQELVEHLVDVVWRWKRAGRMQEGFALRQAKEVNLTREDRVHAHMMRLKMTEESLRLLAESVAREYYITTPADLEKMKRLHQEGVVKEMGEIALALFYRLEKPPEKDEEGLPLDPYERARLMVEQAKEIFGIGRTAFRRPRRESRRNPAVRCRTNRRRQAPRLRKVSKRPMSRRRGRGGTALLLHSRGMGGAGAGAPASGKYPDATGGDLRGAAQDDP